MANEPKIGITSSAAPQTEMNGTITKIPSAKKPVAKWAIGDILITTGNLIVESI
jgi:hypothetical protein